MGNIDFFIGLNALKSNFYNIKKLDLEIDFENVLILENHRDKSIKAGSLGNSDQIPLVKGSAITENDRFHSLKFIFSFFEFQQIF